MNSSNSNISNCALQELPSPKPAQNKQRTSPIVGSKLYAAFSIIIAVVYFMNVFVGMLLLSNDDDALKDSGKL